MTGTGGPLPRPRPVDYQRLFAAVPTPLLVLDADLVVVDANEAYLRVAHRSLDELLGRHVFDAFPDNPAEPQADGVRNLRASLLRARASRTADSMAVQRYDIVVPGRGFVRRYWSPVNVPVLDGTGAVEYLLHQVQDVTGDAQEPEREVGPGRRTRPDL